MTVKETARLRALLEKLALFYPGHRSEVESVSQLSEYVDHDERWRVLYAAAGTATQGAAILKLALEQAETAELEARC